jgi:nicotinate-nucleotide pyrophosphorylase (carboxylating)
VASPGVAGGPDQPRAAPAGAGQPNEADCGGAHLVPAIPVDIAGRLEGSGLPVAQVVTLAAAALAEDLAGGVDVTTAATVPAGEVGRADLVARSAGVVAGLPVAELVFCRVSPR